MLTREEQNIIKNKEACYLANGESEFCLHNICKFDPIPCKKLEEILRGN